MESVDVLADPHFFKGRFKVEDFKVKFKYRFGVWHLV